MRINGKKSANRSRHPMASWIVRITDRSEEAAFHHSPGTVYIWTHDVSCPGLGLRMKTRVLFALSPRHRAFDARIIRPDAQSPRKTPLEAVFWDSAPVSNVFDGTQRGVTFKHEEALRLREALRAVRKWLRRKERKPSMRRLNTILMPAALEKAYRVYYRDKKQEKGKEKKMSVILGQRYGKCVIRVGGMRHDLQKIVRDPIHTKVAGLFAEVTDDKQLPPLLQRWRALQKKTLGAKSPDPSASKKSRI